MSRRPAGYSLMELLIVIAIVGVLVGAAIGSASAGIGERLRSAAELVAGDLAYCRSLAVTHNSQYLATFEPAQNRYVITHSGTDAALDTLPKSVFTDYDDPADAHDVDLDELPIISGEVRLAGARTAGTTPANVTTIEFGPLGQTTRTDRTVLWLMTGAGDSRRFIPISVDPITGLTTIGEVQSSPPGGLVIAAEAVQVGS